MQMHYHTMIFHYINGEKITFVYYKHRKTKFHLVLLYSDVAQNFLEIEILFWSKNSHKDVDSCSSRKCAIIIDKVQSIIIVASTTWYKNNLTLDPQLYIELFIKNNIWKKLVCRWVSRYLTERRSVLKRVKMCKMCKEAGAC